MRTDSGRNSRGGHMAGERPRQGRLRRWLVRSMWATADQALFAFGNVLAGILLARYLPPQSFGAFSSVYSLFLLCGAVHTALLTDPMLVYGPGRMLGRCRGYFSVLKTVHWYLGGVASVMLLLLSAGLHFWLPGAGKGLAMVGLTAPFLLYAWLARRGAYVQNSPGLAAAGSLLYLAGVSIVFMVLAWSGWLDESVAFLIMGGVSWLSGTWIFGRLRPMLAGSAERPSVRDVCHMHLDYGRWILLAALLGWVPVNIYYVALPWFAGLEASAGLRAVLTLAMPALHFNTAMASICIPNFVRAAGQGRLTRVVHGVLAGQMLCMVLFWWFLHMAGDACMVLLYDGRYGAELLGWAALLPIPAAVITVCAAALKAMELPSKLPSVYACGALISLLGGLAAMTLWQLRGALMSIVFSHICMAVMMYIRTVRSLRRRAAAGETAYA